VGQAWGKARKKTLAEAISQLSGGTGRGSLGKHFKVIGRKPVRQFRKELIGRIPREKAYNYRNSLYNDTASERLLLELRHRLSCNPRKTLI